MRNHNKTNLKKAGLIILFFLTYGTILSQNNTIAVNNNIKLIHVTDSFFVHESWYEFPNFGRFSSNGLILIKNKKALLIDTPNDDMQTKQLIDFLKDSLNIEISEFIGTHFHSDCIGGLNYINSIGIRSLTSEQTKQICLEQGLVTTSESFKDKSIFEFQAEQVECKYFGGGHTVDNIIVYFPDHQLLFGGCLIKSLNSKYTGNMEDAVPDIWPETVKKIRSELKDIKYVIPGHGKFGNSELLDHTIKLLSDYNKNKK